MTKSFDNIFELEEQVNNLPLAHFETLHTGQRIENTLEVGEETKVPNIDKSPRLDRFAVVNNESGALAGIVSDKYELIQHRKAFFPMIKALRALDMGISGKMVVGDDKNHVMVKAEFDDEKFEIEDDSVYGVGFMMTNSYDKSSSVVIKGYALRKVCSNGMIIPSEIVPSVRVKHMGDLNPEKLFIGFFDKLGEKLPELEERIREAREDLFEDPVTVLKNVNFPETKIDEVLERVEYSEEGMDVTKELTRKQLYDAMTAFNRDYVEEKDLAMSTEQRYHKKAQKVLVGSKQMLTQEIVEEEG